MPKITVDHRSSKSAPDALTTIQKFFETDADLRRLDPKMTCQFSESTLSGKVNSSQFKADIKVKSEGAGSQVSVVVDLPLLLTPFKGKVEETLKKKLSKYLS
jgi:hypothetical protein